MLVVTGMAVGLEPQSVLNEMKTLKVSNSHIPISDVNKKSEIKNGANIKKADSTDMIFTLDEEHSTDINNINKNNQQTLMQSALFNVINKKCISIY